MYLPTNVAWLCLFGFPGLRVMLINFIVFHRLFSGKVNVTSVWRNPLVNMTIDWTDQMGADFRKYNSDVKKVFPSCRLTPATTTAVGDNSICQDICKSQENRNFIKKKQ